ncbi:MAG: VIT1/CCC1 transporter family protein [Candidatus Aenigmarchaeota archaeon]|nr:VIT1/CCC1 transporter family protein [Candidatus Aenigmarchaeota archaeon]
MQSARHLDRKTRSTILRFQKNEITEHHVYKNLARIAKGGNRRVLTRLSKDELRHYNIWRGRTLEDVRPGWLTILRYIIISSIFGLTFVIKIMEGGERKAEDVYAGVVRNLPDVRGVLEDELRHERALARMLDEDMLHYIGSMVLGLNDALVELTGALAGLTLTLQDTRLIGTAGMITGIAAALSMGASEYLSKRSEKGSRSPFRAAVYTGSVYMLTVALLVLPYFVFASYYVALGVTIAITVSIILLFTFFLSVVKNLPFRKTVIETLMISLGVAAVSFVIGYLVKLFLNV